MGTLWGKSHQCILLLDLVGVGPVLLLMAAEYLSSSCLFLFLDTLFLVLKKPECSKCRRNPQPVESSFDLPCVVPECFSVRGVFLTERQTLAVRSSYSCKTPRNQDLLGRAFPFSPRALCQQLSGRVYMSVCFLWLGWGPWAAYRRSEEPLCGTLYGWFFCFALILRFFRHSPSLQRGRMEEGCERSVVLATDWKHASGKCFPCSTVDGAIYCTLETSSIKNVVEKQLSALVECHVLASLRC